MRQLVLIAFSILLGCDEGIGPADAGRRDVGSSGLDAAPSGPDADGAADTNGGAPDTGGPTDDAGDVGTAPMADTGVLLADAGSDAGPGLPACSCDRVIAPGESTVDLSSSSPGATICLRPTPSPRGPLSIVGVRGTEAAPVVIRNCDGVVEITSSSRSRALTIDGSHFRVTGAGAPGVERGLHFRAPMAPAVVSIGHADHFEVDHAEIDSSSFAGLMAKVDPSSTDCRVGDRRFDSFVMDGVHLHDLFIHDIDGEGIYLGNSFYTGIDSQYCGANPACDNARCGGFQYPHEVRHVRIERVRVERSGWDGIQVGSAVEDCVIADNVVIDFGMENRSSQNNGIQVGQGSSCDVLRNRLERGPTAMNLQGIGGTDVVNNLIVGFVNVGIIVNPRPTALPDDIVPASGYVGGYRIAHNTLISASSTSVPVRDVNVPSNPVPSGNVLTNNLVVHDGTRWMTLTGRYAWSVAGNVEGDIGGFVDAGTGDYCLEPGAPGVDAAVSSGPIPADDLRSRPRPLGPGADVGALECR